MKTISPKILFISPFPPDLSGRAGFTRDLIDALNEETGSDLQFEVCAVEKGESGNIYRPPVSMIMDGHDRNNCLQTAKKIRYDHTMKLLCVEYSEGMFGGEGGSYLPEFLEMADRPFVLRIHNILSEPTAESFSVFLRLSAAAEKILVMTRQMWTLLVNTYQADESKIEILAHGVHRVCKTDPADLKQKAGLHGKKLILNIGNLGRNKCIETIIHSMKKVAADFPDALLLLIGKTEPLLYNREGEKFRNQLQAFIDDHCLRENVILVNHSLSPLHLMEFLAMADIYLHTGISNDAAVNAELLNAMAAGCSIISEPCAKTEEINEETGMVTTGESIAELADEIIYLLENSTQRWDLGRNAYLSTRKFSWDAVARRQLDIFNRVIKSGRVIWPFRDAEVNIQ